MSEKRPDLLRGALSASRFLILIAVIGAFLAAVVILIIGGIETVRLIGKLLIQGLRIESAKSVALSFIQVIDLYLIGTVFYITALGLYELFIDDQVPTPAWLHITSIDDLKARLIGVLVVVMTVVFVGALVDWKGKLDILALGAGIALVVAALKYFLTGGHS